MNSRDSESDADAAPASASGSTAGPDDLRYVGAPRRRAQILRRVRSAGFVSIAGLADELGVSDMTIRRDARRLEQAGEARIVHGGVGLPHATLRTSEFTARADANADAKHRIARAAAALIHPRDAVGFDAGTTTFQIVAQLPATFSGTVITHSVPIFQQSLLLPNTKVTGLGGDLHTPSQAFIGRITVAQLADLRMQIFFLGAAAIDTDGVYVDVGLEVDTKNAFINAAAQVVAVVDSTKFGETSPVLLAKLERIDVLITDKQPGRPMRDALRKAGVRTHIAR